MARATAPAVTVVIPTRDRLALLRETLRSVAAQQPAARVVVVDDGSTDGTATALASSPEVTLLNNPSGGWGSGRARNAGLDAVSTPYVAFVDSDDLLVPGALAAMADALGAAPAAPFAFGRALAAARTADGWVAQGLMAPLPGERHDLAASIFARNVVPSSGALARTDAVRAVGGYDPRLVFSEDHDLWLRLIALGQPIHVPRLVLVHRRHGGNRHSPEQARIDDDTITARALTVPGLAEAQTSRLGMQLCEEGLDALRARRVGEVIATARRRLGGHRGRVSILRAAGRHYRRRVAARTAADVLWTRDGSLRTWLASYD